MTCMTQLGGRKGGWWRGLDARNLSRISHLPPQLCFFSMIIGVNPGMPEWNLFCFRCSFERDNDARERMYLIQGRVVEVNTFRQRGTKRDGSFE